MTIGGETKALRIELLRIIWALTAFVGLLKTTAFLITFASTVKSLEASFRVMIQMFAVHGAALTVTILLVEIL